MAKEIGDAIFRSISVVALILLAMFLLTWIAHAEEDNSKWCGTITAIYGVCSPELIQNYLEKTSHAVFPVASHAVTVSNVQLSQPKNEPLGQQPVSPLYAQKVVCGQYVNGYWGGSSGWWPNRPPFCNAPNPKHY